MSRRTTWRLLTVSILIGAILFAGALTLAGDGNFSIDWWSADSGGSGSGNNYVLGGSAGQADAGSGSSAGLTLSGGFWGGVGPVGEIGYFIYLPVSVKAPS
jgi:hypothetical protein